MMLARKLRNTAANSTLTVASLVVCAIFLEISLRGYQLAKGFVVQDLRAPLHIVTHTPVLYGLNPEHPEINSQGLRDDEVMVPKPKDSFRILVLGDSVAYGADVSRNDTFPNRLERMLQEQHGSVEVINSGVPGYTAYNELHYYLTKGRDFQADLVIVAFCMNDVVNPRLHWRYTKDQIEIPSEAIPNHDYDRNVALPLFLELKRNPSQSRAEPNQRNESENFTEKLQSLLRHSELFGALEPRVRSLLPNQTETGADAKPATPTYITGEKNVGIKVLLDKTSPEWRWLTSIYDRMRDAVQADNAKFMIVIFPLAYQLDADYPFLPQQNLTDYCQERSILCVDLLPFLRAYRKEDIFLVDRPKHYDIWHLTKLGHELSARELLRSLQERDLVRYKK